MTDKPIIHVSSLDKLADHGITKVAIAIGVFDGVHLGHQHLLQAVKVMAEETEATPGVLTFFPHPRQILYEDHSVPLITTQQQKIALLDKLGIGAIVTIPFTREFANLEPESFLGFCCASPRVRLTGICVGTEWRFGKQGRGDTALLKDYAEKGHFLFQSVDELMIGDETVSSTAIRRAIASGCLDKAERMMGRPFRIFGKVIQGRHIATSELSYPTANIQSYNGIYPPNGVYAGYTLYNGRRLPSAIAIGVSPTFHVAENVASIKAEVHIIDFSEDIYGQELEVELIDYLREERCYTSAAKLKEQIQRDVESVRELLRNR